MPKCDRCSREFDSDRGVTVHKNQVHNGQDEAYRSKENLQELYWGKKMSQGEIAERFGTNRSTIDTWMSKLDVEKRDKSESAKNREMPPGMVGSGAPEWVYEQQRKKPANLTVDDYGYMRWRVSDGESYRAIGVHRLVAVANGEPLEKVFSGGEYHVHHKNGVPWDNRPENLELMTKSDHHSLHNNPNKKVIE
jgi:hypothetical protein